MSSPSHPFSAHGRISVNPEFDAFLDEMDHAEAEVAAQKPMLGYPLNNNQLRPLIDLHAMLHRDFTLNNCGDPMENVEKPWKLNTLKQEQRVITRLMKCWGGTPSKCWGYITTRGTEGVTKGVAVGFERLRAHGFENIIVVYSEASHYCVPKAASLAAPGCTKVRVAAADDNSIRLGKLDEVLRAARVMNVDAILMVCTLGTTFFGGCDEITGVQSLLTEHGYGGRASYVHVDAALHGGFWHDHPHTPKYQIIKHFNSICISGHKWFGGFVAGLFLCARKGDASTEQQIEYVGMADKFISGSRSGAPAVLWMARLLQFNWKDELYRCVNNRIYLTNALRSLGLKVASQYVNVIMPRPSAELARKWQLMVVGDEAQVLLMPHATRNHLEEFVKDVLKDVRSGAMKPPTDRLERLHARQADTDE